MTVQVHLPNKINKNQTLRESIAEAIRTSIMKGNLKPGHKISEPALASQFGISRTPVREAFRQLDTEGFLQVTPRRGARVAHFTERDVREFYEIKAVMEGYAAKLATEHISEKEMDKMEQVNLQMEECYRKQDYLRAFRLHNEFHEVFLKASGSEQLYQLIRMLVAKFQRFRILLTISGKSEGSFTQHREIIQAFRARDAKRASELVAENAIFGKEVIIANILGEMG